MIFVDFSIIANYRYALSGINVGVLINKEKNIKTDNNIWI